MGGGGDNAQLLGDRGDGIWGLGTQITDGVGFEAVGAAEPPVGGGEALDEHFLDEGSRLEVGPEAITDSVQLADVFGVVGQDNVLGEQAVPEGVTRGAGLAVRGPGTGGLAGVGTVGGELLVGDGFCGHRWTPGGAIGCRL